MVKDAPDTREALRMLDGFIKGRPLCAHNATFDVSFLRNLGKEYGLTFDTGMLDTLALALSWNQHTGQSQSIQHTSVKGKAVFLPKIP